MQKKKTSAAWVAAALLMMGAALLNACKKDNGAGPDTVSEEEAAEAVSQAVAANTGGMAVQAADAAVMADSHIMASCGVQSGTASVNISGAGSGGHSFQYAGTLVFNGNKTAPLTVGSGATYDIQW